jgi:hypothetical protein
VWVSLLVPSPIRVTSVSPSLTVSALIDLVPS